MRYVRNRYNLYQLECRNARVIYYYFYQNKIAHRELQARRVAGVGISEVNFMIKSPSDKDKLYRGIIDQAASAFFPETRRKRKDFARARVKMSQTRKIRRKCNRT